MMAKRPGCSVLALSVATAILSSTCPLASSFQAATFRSSRSSSVPPPILSNVAGASCNRRARRPILRMANGGGDFFDAISEPAGNGNDEAKKQQPSIDDLAAASEFEEHIPKMNTVTLTGRVGNDLEPRYFDDGKVVLNLSLAAKKKFHPLERKVRNVKYGEEETDWWPLEMWGRDAEFASKYVTKGARIGITGSLIMDTWQDRNTGEARKRHKILVKHLDILESRAEAELRKGGSGRFQGQYYGGGGGEEGGGVGYKKDDDDGGPSSAGTGGFFDD